MWAKYPGTKLIGMALKKGRRMKNSPSYMCLRSPQNFEFGHCTLLFCRGRQRNVQLPINNRAFSHDVKAAILVYQNNETAAMLVYQTNPVGVELFSYVNAFFCSNKFAWLLATSVKTLYSTNEDGFKSV